MNIAVNMALAGIVIVAILAVWSQIKKVYKRNNKKKLIKLEEKRDAIENEIQEKVDIAWAGDSDVWHELHRKREECNRDILRFRQRHGIA